jgi:putative transposase
VDGHRAAAARAGLAGGPGRLSGSYCRRDIVDGIRYLVHNGCVWRALPAALPRWRTVWGYVHDWHASGATARLHDQLREQVRVLAGRRPQPTAAIIDSQSVKAADTVGKASRGYDAGRRPKAVSGTSPSWA